MADGRFLCVLGIDGAGKSSVLRRLVERDPRIELADWKRFEPNLRIPTMDANLSLVEMLAKLDAHALASTVLYVTSLQYDQIIRPALARGSVVIADSYWYKLLARDQIRGAVPAFLEPALRELPQPAHIYLIDTPPEVALQRKTSVSMAEADGKRASFAKFHIQVRERMLALCEGIPMTVLDGTRSIDELVEAIEPLLR